MKKEILRIVKELLELNTRFSYKKDGISIFHRNYEIVFKISAEEEYLLLEKIKKNGKIIYENPIKELLPLFACDIVDLCKLKIFPYLDSLKEVEKDLDREITDLIIEFKNEQIEPKEDNFENNENFSFSEEYKEFVKLLQ
jgi:hypothetical protein